jgi:Undecaprenyl-phosphate galactose phosphotransferase WbaP
MKEDDNFENVLIISKDFNIKELNRFLDIFSNKKIYLIPFLNEINYINSEILEYFNIRTNAIKIENHLLEKKNILIKNIFDIFFALLITPIFLFLHLFIFCLIKLDSKGSVFFKQKRIGKDGKIFVCYKYRTMYENGEEILKEYLKRHPEEKDYYEKYHKYKNDPRITKIGRFLRSTSLDELPQIINILKGEMSFVGPRPYLPKEIIKLKDYKDFIFKVKPGLTGLWQVSGRNNLTFKERMELDKWYIKNWSLWMDFIILIKTFKVVILRIGAK